MCFVFIYVTWIYVGDCYAPNHFHPTKIFGVLKPITIFGQLVKILHQVIDFIRCWLMIVIEWNDKIIREKFFTQLLGNHISKF